MTNQNPFVALILLTSLLCVAGQTNELDAFKRSLGTLGQVALDAITITLDEVTYAKDFMDSIPETKKHRKIQTETWSRNSSMCKGLN